MQPSTYQLAARPRLATAARRRITMLSKQTILLAIAALKGKAAIVENLASQWQEGSSIYNGYQDEIAEIDAAIEDLRHWRRVPMFEIECCLEAILTEFGDISKMPEELQDSYHHVAEWLEASKKE